VSFFIWIVPPQSATAVEEIEGLDAIKSFDGVDDVHVNRPPGSAVDSKEGSAMGHVVKIDGIVASHRELLALDRAIKSRVQVTWRSGAGDGAAAGPGSA
jgi:hypothetical protein